MCPQTSSTKASRSASGASNSGFNDTSNNTADDASDDSSDDGADDARAGPPPPPPPPAEECDEDWGSSEDRQRAVPDLVEMAHHLPARVKQAELRHIRERLQGDMTEEQRRKERE